MPDSTAIPRPPPRHVASLFPAGTEMLFAVGAGTRLVARSHECDYPPGLGVPVVTRPALSPHADPAAIDRAVRELAARARPLVDLDTQMLADLKPDLILAQDLCDVCAASGDGVREAAASIGAEVLAFAPHGVEDVLDDLLRLARVVGTELTGAAMVVALRERLFHATDFVNPYVEGPCIALLEWTDPLFIGGHWNAQLVERAGGRHPLNPTRAPDGLGSASGPQHARRIAPKSFRVTPEQLVASRPEYVIIAPCGLDLARALDAARALAREPWWRELPAARAGRVAIVDGNQMFNRPGPRLADAFEWLVSWLHDRPELTPPGFPWTVL